MGDLSSQSDRLHRLRFVRVSFRYLGAEMTDDGTFNCPIKWTQQAVLSNWVGTLDANGQGGLVPLEVRQLAGRINWYAEQAKGSAPWPAGTFGPVIVDNRTFTASDPQDIVSDIDASRLYALPLRLPSEPWTSTHRLDMQAAEWGGPSVGMTAWFSTVAGDWASKVGEPCGGNQPMPFIDDCLAAGLHGGATLYFNIAFWDGAVSYQGVKSVRSGGHWPR